MIGTAPRVSEIAAGGFRLFAANPGPASLYFLVLVAGGTLMDAGLGGSDTANFLSLILSAVTFVAQYAVTRTALRESGPAPAALIARWFLLGILLSLAIIVGLVLLIIPGIILIVRLSVALPAMLDDSLSFRESVEASWRDTRPMFWPLLILFAALSLPWVALYVLAAMGPEEPFTLPTAALLNLVLNGGLIAGWYISTSAFLLARSDAGGLSKVFA